MPDSVPIDESQRRALDVFDKKQSFLLSSHVQPDGDCIGSQAGLASVLRSLGKEVVILNPDPPEVQFEFFTEGLGFGVYTGGDLPQHDVSVLLDISELARCGKVGPPIGAADSLKMIVDHHLHAGETWWDEAFVDMTASATGFLVYRIAEELGVQLDQVAANGIFAAIVSDTGWFKYSNTDSRTLAAASDLVKRGVDPSAVYDELHQRHRPEQPGWIAHLLARAEYHADHRLVVVDLPRSDVEVSEHVDSELVLDVLRSVDAVEVVLFLRELADGSCKVSARSKSDYDVNALAREFGGGGHRKASGATLPGPLEMARRLVIEAALAGFEAHARSEG